jgi:hypothetical protein
MSKAISVTVEKMPSVADSSIHMQFVKMLVELSPSQSSNTSLVIVLNALDECGTPKEHDSLLTILVEETPLPDFLHIIVTSRAEFDIHAAFKSQAHYNLRIGHHL